MFIARLIADTGLQETGDVETRLNAASKAFAAHNMPLASAAMLDVGVPVLEMRFEEGDRDPIFGGIESYFAPCDALVCEHEIRIPRLLVSDMDSTMIGQECIDELADFAGLKDRIAAITERAMQGELDFESALLERVALLKGLEEAAIGRCLSERITATPGANVLLSTLKAHGTRSVLVTGGFHHFADRVGDALGFDRVVGNRLEVADGKLTGRLDGPICDASTKEAVLKDEADKLGAGTHTIAAGDGANDIPMIKAANYGFAYRAKPKARVAANGRVDAGDLTSILTLLGIPRRDWVGM